MRYLVLSSLLALGLTASSQVPDYVPTDGLVAWWDMNGDGEDSGPFQINPVNNGYSSGVDRFGNATGAFNSHDRHINYGVHPEIQNESFSFAAWINPTTPSGAAHKTFMGYHNDTEGGATLGLVPNNRVKFHTNHWENEGLISSEPIIAGTWAHLVGTYSQGVLSLYIDGQLDIELEGIESPNSNNENFEVGRWTGGDSQYFNGLIDDVGVWNRRLDVDEIIGLYAAEVPVYGCVDTASCNFNPESNLDDGSCEYGCFNCGPGTIWDDDSQLCIVANPSDTDFDGCVSMTDLLDLLTVFGTCNEIPWSCGDPLEYQDYDYETVQIGEQCWFAENLRTSTYRSGETIALWDYEGEVVDPGIGHYTYKDLNPDNVDEFGLLYTWHTTSSVCPSGWHVPLVEEFELLLEYASQSGFSSNTPEALQSTSYWPSGLGVDAFGFNALPGGERTPWGNLAPEDFEHGFWWMSDSSEAPNVFHLSMSGDASENFLGIGSCDNPDDAMSIRCIQDSE
jgi:uncharacterized protein (TIGR02145 family)